MAWKLNCDVCGDDFEDIDPNLQSCRKCQSIIKKYKGSSSKKKKYPPVNVKIALRKAYSHKEYDDVYFKCEYTGIVSKFNDSNKTVGHFEDPFVLTLDHIYPNQKELVVSLNIINKMKGNIPPNEFKEIIIALGDFFKQETRDKINTRNSQEFEMVLRELCPISHDSFS